MAGSAGEKLRPPAPPGRPWFKLPWHRALRQKIRSGRGRKYRLSLAAVHRLRPGADDRTSTAARTLSCDCANRRAGQTRATRRSVRCRPLPRRRPPARQPRQAASSANGGDGLSIRRGRRLWPWLDAGRLGGGLIRPPASTPRWVGGPSPCRPGAAYFIQGLACRKLPRRLSWRERSPADAAAAGGPPLPPAASRCWLPSRTELFSPGLGER